MLCHIKLCSTHSPQLYFVNVVYKACAVGAHDNDAVFLRYAPKLFLICLAFCRSLFGISCRNDDRTGNAEIACLFEHRSHRCFRCGYHYRIGNFRQSFKRGIALHAAYYSSALIYKVYADIILVLQRVYSTEVTERCFFLRRANDCNNFWL